MKKALISFVFVLFLFSYSHALNVYYNYVSTSDNYDIYAVNIYNYDDSNNAILCSDAVIGIYVSTGQGISHYFFHDGIIRYPGIDYLYLFPMPEGRYYTYLKVPSGFVFPEGYISIYYEGCNTIDYSKYIYAFFIIVIIFYAFGSILWAL